MISVSSIALIFIFSLGINKCELSGLCLVADILMGIAAKEMIEFKVEQAIEDLKSVETE